MTSAATKNNMRVDAEDAEVDCYILTPKLTGVTMRLTVTKIMTVRATITRNGSANCACNVKPA